MESYLLSALIVLISINTVLAAESWRYLPTGDGDSKKNEPSTKTTTPSSTPGIDSNKYKLLHYLAAAVPSARVPLHQVPEDRENTREDSEVHVPEDDTHGATSRGGSSALNDVDAHDPAHVHAWSRENANTHERTNKNTKKQERMGSTAGCGTYFEDPANIPPTYALRWQAICQGLYEPFCHNGATCTLEVTSFMRSVGFPYACQCQPGYTGYCCQHTEDAVSAADEDDEDDDEEGDALSVRPTSGIPQTRGLPVTTALPQSSLPYNGGKVITCNNYTGPWHVDGETDLERYSRICQDPKQPLCSNGGRCSLDVSVARLEQGYPYTCRCPAGFGGPCCQYEACRICPCVYGETCVANTEVEPWRKCYRYSHEEGYLKALEILRPCP